jgi:hypothetical protein
MRLIDLIATNRLEEAKELIYEKINDIAARRLEEVKKAIPEIVFEEVEEELDEAVRRTPNIVRMGRIKKIRRRIRRNKKGKIVVQRNVKRSAVKGYRISGNTVKRIPAIQRIQKTRKLKRYWKTKGKARLKRTIFKRNQSLRRRKSMGIK